MEYLFICGVFALSTGLTGKVKGSSFILWAMVGAVLPFIGLLAVLLYRNERAEPHRACPGCGKVVPLHDALCTRCGTELEFPSEPLEPAVQR